MEQPTKRKTISREDEANKMVAEWVQRVITLNKYTLTHAQYAMTGIVILKHMHPDAEEHIVIFNSHRNGNLLGCVVYPDDEGVYKRFYSHFQGKWILTDCSDWYGDMRPLSYWKGLENYYVTDQKWLTP